MADDGEKLIKLEKECALLESSQAIDNSSDAVVDIGCAMPCPTDSTNNSNKRAANWESEISAPINGIEYPCRDEKPDSPGQAGSINDPQVNATENNPADEVTNESTPKQKLTVRQKLTFVGIALTYLSSSMSFAVLAPFFSIEAQKKGVTPTETGFVFSLFALVSFLSSPLFGKYLPVIGGKFLFLSGAFVAGGSSILFGVLDEIEGKELFLTYCFVIRAVEALGSSACITAGMAIVANVFPDNVAQMGGILEAFSGIGCALGPALGSFLYGIGGYKLPFLVLGGTTIAVASVNIFILPSLSSATNENHKAGSLLKVIKIPAVWLICIVLVLASASLAFSDPTLSPHLTGEDFKLKPSLVGVMYVLLGGVYAATAPFWGRIADKTKATRFIMAIGFWLIGVSFLLVGPSPLLNLPNNIWIISFSVALLGLSFGCAITPPYLDLLISTSWYGLPDDISTQAIVSGLFNGFLSFGEFLGPSLAGVLVDNIGFDWSATIFAGGNFLAMILICLFGIWEFQCGKGRRKPSNCTSQQNPDTSEDTAPLVVNT